jgi:N-acyl-D-aspartate/D-glutamate deacylase
MGLDLVIKNGTVVDGTGRERYRADVGVADGRIVEIGKVKDGAAKVIDASDLIVAPGFFDPHTHYDAQICWDPLVTCSSWHGVTSVVMGNCGVGIAPCKPETREIATWDLVNVEGIPFDVLAKGTTWDWQSFPEYMDAAARRRSGLNLAFLAPLTPFRHYVMGEESMERAARPDEIAQIKALVKEAVAAGAVGFSHTRLRQHIGYQGRPLACRQANLDELKAYANALKELGRGAIEISLSQEIDSLSEEEAHLLDTLLIESGRPVTWLSLVPLHGHVETCLETLDRIEPLIARGGIPQVTAHTSRLQLNLRNPFLMASLNSWKSVFNKSPEEQKKIYAEPGFRNAFREEMSRPQIFTSDWNKVDVDLAGGPAVKQLEGKTILDISRERGRDPFDTFLDVALEDDLATWFSVSMMDESILAPLLNDRRTLIGLADGGAHVDLLCDAGYCTYLIGTWSRDKQVLSLEDAVRRITSEPAALFGFPERGRLAAGLPADIAIFDYRTIGSTGRAKWLADLPGGGRRLIIPAQGVEYTVVNGEVLFEHGQHTGAMPGRVLRLGAAA